MMRTGTQGNARLRNAYVTTGRRVHLDHSQDGAFKVTENIPHGRPIERQRGEYLLLHEGCSAGEQWDLAIRDLEIGKAARCQHAPVSAGFRLVRNLSYVQSALPQSESATEGSLRFLEPVER
eukprot:9487166-Pyramimonas_sp.AAC.1